ncbi:GNAT family N-acetyltransferase [Lactiplantibacillus herbarum]|uniref:GNAT family N-acetyltransferase n=1 Tax=Lactiplantibacillus herbarum TaxID=1670446 RepID=UPI00064FA8D4|nr:GNAT family N-acetyltransferase [Lactiplantibacillus herbarum]
MTHDYQIVNARANSDFNEIRQLYYDTWQSAYRNLLPISYLQQLTPATWHPERRWQNMLLATTMSGKVIGVCSFGPARHAARTGCGELYSIYVQADYQSLGVGRQLIEQALQRLQRNFTQIYLLVLADNVRAQRFYQRCGFQDTRQIYVDHAPFGDLREQIFEWQVKR